MGVVRYLGSQPVSLGGVLEDAHEMRKYEVDGLVVDVFVNGESLSQYMNEMAVYHNKQTFPVGRKSKAIHLSKGYGIWLLVDDQGFSFCHLYIIPTVGELDYEQLDRLVEFIEDQMEREWQEATSLDEEEDEEEVA
jgi:inosine/xanthosine triphosphate pyrophosphatase family protein